jgi:hypothetical protein
MFFLSGLGMIRVGWLPFMDISFDLLNLGQIAFLPYRILIWFFSLVFMATGAPIWQGLGSNRMAIQNLPSATIPGIDHMELRLYNFCLYR